MRAFLALAVVSFAVPDREDLTPKEARPPQERILGDWRIEYGPSDNVLRVLRIERNKMMIVVDGKPWPEDAFSGACTIDWSTSPATFDYIAKNHRGILRLDGDQLTMCLALGGKRPTSFDGNTGGHPLKLVRMKR